MGVRMHSSSEPTQEIRLSLRTSTANKYPRLVKAGRPRAFQWLMVKAGQSRAFLVAYAPGNLM
jgi:hypothetical protein